MIQCANINCGRYDDAELHNCQHWNTVLYQPCGFIEEDTAPVEAHKILNDRAAVLVEMSKPTSVWRVLIDECFITMPSGKSSWKQKGHAKNALRNAMNTVFYDCRSVLRKKHSDMSSQEQNVIFEEYYTKFLDERVQFVQI